MKLWDNNFEIRFEKAVRLLGKYMPDGKGRKKPAIIHSLRVGFYLYQNNYSEDIILAGLLHDVIEWSKSPRKLISKEFGSNVFELILANTQNPKIKDTVGKWQDMVDRCAKSGKNALIVKAADVLDSFYYYKAVKNSDEIMRSVSIGRYILKKLPRNVNDPIFKELKKLK